jgi:hypothetical protein
VGLLRLRGPLVGRPWPIAYRRPQEQRLRHLRDLGVRAFATLLYAHKPQMAASLNDWVSDVAQLLGLADRYPSVHLDTTMVFVDFFGGAEAQAATARALAPRLDALRDRVLLGSDFPNIPYAYAHQIEALDRVGLGPDWMREVLWHNGARIFGLDRAGEP